MKGRESRLYGPDERMYAIEWLDPETGVLSVQDLEGDGTGPWPPAEVISEWVNVPVKVFGVGTGEKYPEMIYVRQEGA